MTNYYAEWNGNLYRFFSHGSRNLWMYSGGQKKGARRLKADDPRVIEAEKKLAEKRRRKNRPLRP